jgi:AcrR family transcriptional regulator
MLTDPDNPPVTRRFTERSADTRAAILDAARTRFAADGYEKATIRAIAAEAGIDASMVMRYYGDKAGLFRAAAFADVDLTGLGAPGSSGELPDVRELAARVARVLLQNWDSGENQVQRLLVRTAFTHPEAVAQLQRFLDERLEPPFLALLGDDPDAELRVALVFSHTLGVLSARYLLGLEPISSADPELIEASLRDAIEVVLTRPMRGPKP